MVKIRKRIAAILIFVIVLTGAFSINLGQAAAATKGTANDYVKEVQKYNGKTLSSTKTAMRKAGNKNIWDYKGDWCAWYVSQCAANVGLSKEIPKDSWAYNLPGKVVLAGGNAVFFSNAVKKDAIDKRVSKAKSKKNQYTVKSRSSYTPQKGDLIFYDWNKNNVIEHVEVVTDYKNGTVYAIGGNAGKAAWPDSKVATRKISRSSSYIVAYARPKYADTKTYTAKYDANGGSGTMANTTVTMGVQTPLRANAYVKEGYKFAGWTAKRSNNTWLYYNPLDTSKSGWYTEGMQPNGWVKYVYRDKQTVANTCTKDKDYVTFYAQWEQNTAYTLYYNANGGNVSPSAMEVTEGARFSITRVIPEKEGYTFAGWTVLRLSDNKSYVTGRGWFTEEEIENQGYTKRVYTPGELYTFDAAWTTGYAGTSDYLFIAQWEKEESTDPIEEPNPPFIEPEPPVVDPEPPITEPEQPDNESKVIGFVSETEYNANYAGNSAYTATPYYRYATRQKEYTESTASSMAGWTQYNQVTTPASSTWSKTKPSGAYETGYQYYCWGWEHNGDWTFYYDDNYNEAVAWIKKNYSVWNYNQFRYFWQVYSANKGSSVKITQNVNYRDNNGKTGTKYITDTKLWYEGQVYRAKASTKYQYWRWGSWSAWSGWSTQKQSTGDTVKEERQYYVVKR